MQQPVPELLPRSCSPVSPLLPGNKFQKYLSEGKLNLHTMGATTPPPFLLVSITPPTFSPWRPGDAYSREKAEVRTIAKNGHICLSNLCSILKLIFLKVHLPDETTVRCIMYGHSSCQDNCKLLQFWQTTVRSYSFQADNCKILQFIGRSYSFL